MEKPTPKNHEVLVRIHATTVTFGDATLRRMKFPLRMAFGLFMGGMGKGKILGNEFAGEIEAVGVNVTKFKKGDQIYASPGMTSGAHAEYICVHEDAMITTKPTNMTYEEAAASVDGSTTACIFSEIGGISNAGTKS